MKNYILALLNLLLGALVGLLLLEAVLWVNPRLLLRGMALPVPVDAPLTSKTYEVRYSDADAFIWRPDLIRPVPPEADRLEALVTYRTDEFGFRNLSPLPERVGAVVLGRSISLAAHLQEPWAALLARQAGLVVANLSQPGSDIWNKSTYLKRFGMPRRPRWVIVEVVPSIDFLDRRNPAPLLSQQAAAPLIQGLWRRFHSRSGSRPGENAIYPLAVDLPGRTLSLTCCLHYLEFFTLDSPTIQASRDWSVYRKELLNLIGEARSGGACIALLYAPTKPDIYFSLASDPEQLSPALSEVIPLVLDRDGKLVSQPDGSATVDVIRANAFSGREVIRTFAQEQGLAWIDPTESFVQSVLDGEDPFMVYDSHWNAIGHQLVARAVAEGISDTLTRGDCP